MVALTIRRGGTIEWRNTSLITHTVTDDSKLALNARSLSE